MRFKILRKLKPKMFKKRKKISLVGWYGQGAHGDDIMEIAVKKLFKDVVRRKHLSLEWVSEKQADLVIVGGGTILGADSMHIYDRLKNIKAPLVFFGGGFRREKRDIGLENIQHMKELLKKALLKGVRGYLSQQSFVQIGITNTEVIGDPSLTFNPVRVEQLFGKFKVGVSIRAMGKTGEYQYIDNKTNAKNFAAICDYLVKVYKATLYFFDFTENVHDSDAEGAQSVISQMRYRKGHTFISFKRDTEELFSLLGQMDYVVSQRLHPTILAWIQGIPCVAFEYHYNKTFDFMSTIGMDEFVIRTDEFDLQIYKKKFTRLLNEKELIMTQVKKSINYWKDKQKNFANRCLDIIS